MSTFVSYAREDHDVALRFTDDLRAAGIDVWIDQRDIRGGEQWDRAVEKALEESSAMLVILSPDAVQSRTVMDEVSYALEEGKHVVPVLHRQCKIPLRMRRLQYIDVTSSYEKGLARVVEALKSPLRMTAETPVPLPPRTVSTRRKVFQAAAIGAAYGTVCSLLVLDDWIFALGGILIAAVLLAAARAISSDRRPCVITAAALGGATALAWAVWAPSATDVFAALSMGGPGGALAGAAICRGVTALKS